MNFEILFVCFRISGEESIQTIKKKSAKNFQWAFGLNKLFLDLTGLWQVEATQLGYKNVPVFLTFYRIPIMVFFLVSFIVFPTMHALFRVAPNLTLITENLTTNCAAVTATAKIFLLWYNQDALQPVLREVLRDWSNDRTPWEHRMMTKQAGYGRIFTISGYTMMLGSMIGFVLAPRIGINWRTINNITDTGLAVGRVLPIQTYFACDLTYSPCYEIVYTGHMIAAVFTGISLSAPDNLFGALVYHATAQCRILAVHMSRIVDGVTNDGNNEQLYRTRLRYCAQRHVHLIRFIRGVERTFNLAILAQIVCLSVIMCGLGFGIIESLDNDDGNHMMQIVILVVSAFTMMVHMLVYCLANESLLEHSSQFLFSIYNSEWYSIPIKHRKDLLLIMVRSKYPLRLTAGGFIDLNLNTFLA
ncbi:hypothetical protein QAD02_000540, partial [Eretmocerus hayati]